MKKHLKDYFIPHAGNEYQPHSLQKTAMGAMACLVLLSFIATNAQSWLWTSSDWLVSTILPAVIVELTNDERSGEALGTLSRNSVLDAAATQKAKHMATEGYFAHFAPDGTSPWYFFGAANYNFVHAGENLAIHFTDSDEVVDAWMDSPTHRANILNGDYAEIGVGTAKGSFEGYDTVFVVQLFGTPAAVSGVPSATPEPLVEPPVVVPSIAEAPVAIVEPEPAVVLAESVEITETVEVVEPELVPVEIINIVATDSVPIIPTVSPEETATVTPDTITAAAPVTIYSDFLATTTGGVPASVKTVSDGPADSSSVFAKIATQPQLVLQILYTLLAIFIIGTLLLSILIELERQQPVQIAYSVALLFLMYGLFKVHTILGSGVVVV